ncbi:MAG: VanZ family protein [Nanoarchaeota archaeon]
MITFLEKHSKIPIAIAIIIAIAMFYISSLQFGQGGSYASTKSNLYHLAIFFLLSLFMLIGIIKRKKFRLIPIVIAIAIMYAALDELHQYFVPGRYCSSTDFLVDTAGILLSLGLYFILIKSQNLNTAKNI